MAPIPRPATERFWPKVNKVGPIGQRPSLGPCWIWTGGTAGVGYGSFEAGTRLTPRRVYAHKFAYEELVGPVPLGLELDHLCRVRKCVRPEHLEPVTHRVNVGRGEAPSAATTRRGICNRGHPRTPENLYLRSNGKHSCRVCAREHQANRRVEGKALQYHVLTEFCRKGHRYIEVGVYERRDGYRQCRQCMRNADKRRRAKTQ